MFLRMSWCAAALAVIGLAGFDGGPNAVEQRRLTAIFGAEPEPEPNPVPLCNGINLPLVGCPTGCGDQYRKHNSALSGGVNNMRYDPGTSAACRNSSNTSCPTDWFNEVLTTMGCTPQQVP
jgi:hypothetical protein